MKHALLSTAVRKSSIGWLRIGCMISSLVLVCRAFGVDLVQQNNQNMLRNVSAVKPGLVPPWFH